MCAHHHLQFITNSVNSPCICVWVKPISLLYCPLFSRIWLLGLQAKSTQVTPALKEGCFLRIDVELVMQTTTARPCAWFMAVTSIPHLYHINYYSVCLIWHGISYFFVTNPIQSNPMIGHAVTIMHLTDLIHSQREIVETLNPIQNRCIPYRQTYSCI